MGTLIRTRHLCAKSPFKQQLYRQIAQVDRAMSSLRDNAHGARNGGSAVRTAPVKTEAGCRTGSLAKARSKQNSGSASNKLPLRRVTCHSCTPAFSLRAPRQSGHSRVRGRVFTNIAEAARVRNRLLISGNTAVKAALYLPAVWLTPIHLFDHTKIHIRFSSRPPLSFRAYVRDAMHTRLIEQRERCNIC